MEDKLEPILTMIAKDTHEKLSEANINLENNIQQGARIEKEVLSAGETSKQILAEISKPKEEKGPIEIKIPGVEMVTLKGEKGDRGDKGDRGEKGERGDQGPRGEKGADSTVPGPKGDIGPQGERGPQGEAKTGERGPKGDRGERGEKGESGSPDTGAEIISKIKAVKEGRLNIDDIDGTGLFVRKSERNDTGYLRELSDVDLGSLEPANGQALIYNSTTKKWSPGTVASTGGGTPASPNSSVQFNNAGAFGGSSEFTWNNATKTLNVQASSDDGSTLSQRWMDSNGDARAYVASNGDAFFNHITAGDLVDGPVKSSGGSLTNSAIDLNSTDVTGVLQVTKGGTGLSAFASGDIIYASAANTLSARAIGSSGDILTVSGGFPVWASTSSLLDGTYLRLDTTNGPLTGNLFVTKTDAKLRATDNTGSINYSELFANSTEVGFNFSIIDGESTGAIRYDGVSFSLSTNLSDAYTFSSSALLYFSGTSSSTQPAFYIIGDRAVSGTNTNGGDVVITPGISRGSGTSNSILQATGGGSSGTAESNPVTVATFAYNRATVTTPITCTAINTGNGDVELYQSGTYTPTLTNTTNVAASTARLCTYYRVGNAVTVSGQLDIDPTGAGAVLLGISLPIASNFSTAFQLGGTASSIAIANESAGIQADATNDRASLQYVAVDTTNHTMTFTFTYQVI